MDSLISLGTAYDNLGVANSKALSPRVAVVRTSLIIFRHRLTNNIIKTLTYEGARPLKILVNLVHPTDDFT
mgnify:CR=1 FL=1